MLLIFIKKQPSVILGRDVKMSAKMIFIFLAICPAGSGIFIFVPQRFAVKTSNWLNSKVGSVVFYIIFMAKKTKGEKRQNNKTKRRKKGEIRSK